MSVITDLLSESWSVLAQMAPYLLFGFLVAGILSVWVSPALVERHLGGSGLLPVVKASLFGVPLPLCSCGVIPVSASIRNSGASRAATTSFLLSTPQTGVDSIAVSYALLGPVFAVFRPVAAFVTGICGGLLIHLFGPGESRQPAAVTCQEPGDCCGHEEVPAEPPPTFGRKVRHALRYALVTLPRDIGASLAVGILIAGALGAVLPPNALAAYMGGGILSILLMMAAGVPLYVCATSSVPIAAGAMAMGASPGAALAFLIAGPATNAATVSTVWKVMGRRTAVIYLATVAASAVVCGLLLNRILPVITSAMPELEPHAGHSMLAWHQHAAAVALLLVLVGARLLPARTGSAGKTAAAADGMNTAQLSITGMTCSHCADSVKRALEARADVDRADVDLDAGHARVQGTFSDPAAPTKTAAALGYQAAPAG